MSECEAKIQVTAT